jgi:hypothetical protein
MPLAIVVFDFSKLLLEPLGKFLRQRVKLRAILPDKSTSVKKAALYRRWVFWSNLIVGLAVFPYLSHVFRVLQCGVVFLLDNLLLQDVTNKT